MNNPIPIEFKRLNHIQLCIPKNKEDEGKKFYCDLLGLKEIEKPLALRKNGGFWLKIADIELHIGTENLKNESKRHPAFEVEKLNKIKTNLVKNGIAIKEDKSLPLFNRFSFYDPFNNRIELLERKTNEELEFLGEEVKVQINKPINSKHSRYDFNYALNYGCIEVDAKINKTTEIGVYIIGESNPIKEFTGIVKAVIVRYNDDKNNLIVAPKNYKINREEIKKAISFQEKYFDTELKLLEN